MTFNSAIQLISIKYWFVIKMDLNKTNYFGLLGNQDLKKRLVSNQFLSPIANLNMRSIETMETKEFCLQENQIFIFNQPKWLPRIGGWFLLFFRFIFATNSYRAMMRLSTKFPRVSSTLSTPMLKVCFCWWYPERGSEVSTSRVAGKIFCDCDMFRIKPVEYLV